MSRQEVRIFVSYSHRNRDGAARFLEAFEEYCRCSKTYAYRFWKDTELKIGERWEEAIRQNLTKSHCGLLLISPALLSSGHTMAMNLSKVHGAALKLRPLYERLTAAQAAWTIALWSVDAACRMRATRDSQVRKPSTKSCSSGRLSVGRA